MKRKFTFMMISLFVATMMMAEEVDIDRKAWTVTTQVGEPYVQEGTVAGSANNSYSPDGWFDAEGRFTTGNPESMFDGESGTFLALVKPGKSFSPGHDSPAISQQPADVLASFTIDMGSVETFNYFKWQHRYGVNPIVGSGTNTYNYLRVFAIKLEGSNNLAEEFAPIGNADEIFWIPNIGGYAGSVNLADPEIYTIPVPQSSYQYVKVTPVMWSDRYHGEHPDSEGDGATSGSTMQIAEFGLGNSTQAGISKLAHPSINVYPTQVRAGQSISIVLGDESTNASVSVSTLLGVKLNDKHVSGRQVEQTIATKGVYIIEVKKNAERYVTKVVVK